MIKRKTVKKQIQNRTMFNGLDREIGVLGLFKLCRVLRPIEAIILTYLIYQDRVTDGELKIKGEDMHRDLNIPYVTQYRIVSTLEKKGYISSEYEGGVHARSFTIHMDRIVARLDRLDKKDRFRGGK